MKYTISTFIILAYSFWLSFIMLKIDPRSATRIDVEWPFCFTCCDEKPEKSTSDWKGQLSKSMRIHQVPGASVAIIKNGKLIEARGFGKIQAEKSAPITTETMFSVGSLSKVMASVMVLDMTEEGHFDVDSDVNSYLRSWKIPTSPFAKHKAVSVRSILSHTSGLSVHGFYNYDPDEQLPTTVDILSGRGPAKNAPVRLIHPVGKLYDYSGGGTTVMQLFVEDISGNSFENEASKRVFSNLGMTRSSFQNPLPRSFEPIAKAHDRSGNVLGKSPGYHSMPEKAACGLWVSPSDFSKVLIDLWRSYHNDNGVLLTQNTVKDMSTPVSPSEYGMGPRIEQIGDHTIIYHEGVNDMYIALFRFNITTGDGYIIFTNSSQGHRVIRDVMPQLENLMLS